VLQTAVCVVPLSIGHYTEASSNEIWDYFVCHNKQR
jgi:hypothetical protein